MDRRSLEFFHAVASSGSVSGAATLMSVTQPAVSKQIGALEKSLGLKLFHRTSAGMSLTAAGDALMDLGGDVLTRFRRIEGAMSTRFSGQPTLRIAAPHTTASVLIAPFMADTNPPISDLTIQANPNLDHLLDHEVDMAISTFRPPAFRRQMVVANLLIRVYGQVNSMNETFGKHARAHLERINDETLFTPQTGVHSVVSEALSQSIRPMNTRPVATGLIAQALVCNNPGFALATETESFGLQGRPAAFNNQLLFSPLYASWDAGHYAARELRNLALNFKEWMLTTPPWSDDAKLRTQN